MSMLKFSTFSLNLSDLPAWRKSVAFCALAIGCFLGAVPAVKETSIYQSASNAPAVAMGQTTAVYVMHGSLRYVTRKEADDLVFWREKVGPLIGVPFVTAFVVLTMFRKERKK
jgi:hypothetical protein